MFTDVLRVLEYMRVSMGAQGSCILQSYVIRAIQQEPQSTFRYIKKGKSDAVLGMSGCTKASEGKRRKNSASAVERGFINTAGISITSTPQQQQNMFY